MKISVITVCYNSTATIGDTINSIARQSYADDFYMEDHVLSDVAKIF